MDRNPPKTVSTTNKELERYIEQIKTFSFDVVHSLGDSNRMSMAYHLSGHPEDNIENIQETDDNWIGNSYLFKKYKSSGIILEEWKKASKDYDIY